MGYRCFAFLLDCILAGVVTLFLLDRILLPLYHPAGLEEMKETMQAYEAAAGEALDNQTEVPQLFDYMLKSDNVMDMLKFILSISMLVFFTYFFFFELFMRGTTLGKKMFRIQTISMETSSPPGFMQAFLRAAMKTIMLLGSIPFTWLSFILAFFTSQKRTGHDILTRTLVVSEMHLPAKVKTDESVIN